MLVVSFMIGEKMAPSDVCTRAQCVGEQIYLYVSVQLGSINNKDAGLSEACEDGHVPTTPSRAGAGTWGIKWLYRARWYSATGWWQGTGVGNLKNIFQWLCAQIASELNTMKKKTCTHTHHTTTTTTKIILQCVFQYKCQKVTPFYYDTKDLVNFFYYKTRPAALVFSRESSFDI